MRKACLAALLLTAARALSPPRPLAQRRQHRTAPIAALPSLPAVAAACTLPTCLGLWRSGYAVSYGYGGAMLAAGALALPRAASGVARAHALALIFYGMRLDLYLLWRELALPEAIHQMKRRDATLPERLKRLPVVVGCSALYYCMAAPLRVTAACAGRCGAPAAVAVALAFVGFGIAAAGDLVKAYVKARDGAETLVTVGPFRWLRHPNYTGEMMGWAASFAAAVLAAAAAGNLRSQAGWLATSALGAAGIFFVLAGEATAGLEKKQKEKYGGTPEYDSWIARSWSGPMLKSLS